MTPDEFRRHGREVIDWIADYMKEVERYPVLSQVQPGQIRGQLPAAPPEHPEPFEAILQDVDRVILPGITHWQSPNFFAYFPSNTSGPSILGDLLCAGLGVQGMLWATSPACTEVETHVLDWFADMLGLPGRFRSAGSGGGVIQDSASSATLCAILAARQQATAGQPAGVDVRDKLVAYTSTQAHSSVEKGMRIAGLGTLRQVEVDANFALRADLLAQQIEADRAAGLHPFFVSATVGTTSSTAIDPLEQIGPLCRRHGLWLHVDAAMAGTLAVCPELRWILAGIEHADSFVCNPHKVLLTGFDCSTFYLADRGPLIRALSILPEYLRNQATQSGAVIDYRDWQVPLGRRFRALKLWFVIRSYGVEGLRRKVRGFVELARQFAAWVQADPRFELSAPAPLNLVCFRHRGGDGVNQRILDHLNASGQIHLSHTRLAGQLTLRLSIGQTNTARRHVERAWRLIQEAAEKHAPEPLAGGGAVVGHAPRA
jgi:aromatic-L-amino-acid decarboxylase